MNRTMKLRLYRIEVTNKANKRIRHLAEVKARLDEDARRKIVHQTIIEGGRVHLIEATEDRTRHPGEKAKRHYGQV